MISADGTPIFVTDWRPDSGHPSSDGIVLMHGLGEHCGRYPHVAQVLNEAGFTVRAFDHRGHGRSGGPRGDVPDSECLTLDAKMVVDDFTQQMSAPPILFGHSMGGLVAARFAVEKRSPLRGLILSSPALAISLSAGQKILLKILGAIAPGLTLPNGLEKRFLSHDSNVVDAYIKDPLVHGKISARLLKCMLASIDIAQSGAATLQVPTLMLVAGDDHIVDAGGAEAFFQHLPPGAGTLHSYPQLYHEIFNELGAERVFDVLRNWLKAL